MLAPLCFYKYAHFALSNVALAIPGVEPWVPPKGHLPIGISFYSFQALAYVLDVRRGQAAERDPVRYATFLCFFPHLVAGPILRASNLLGQLAKDRTLPREDVGYGIFRLCVGLLKKLLVADVLQQGIVDTVFTDPSAFTGLEVLVALYAYTLQIYADFSGYTDFAIGSARLLGFEIPENFDRPYQATSVANYWRRWHKTLSDWVQDYVYFPLGGSRGGGLKPYVNTMVTLVILGVWHGANWTFVVYGVLHGLAVSLNRWWRKRPGWTEPAGAGLAWRWALTFQFVVVARILFRADDLAHAGRVATALISRWDTLAFPRYSLHAWAVLTLGYAVHFSPKAWALAARARFSTLPALAWGVTLALVGWACTRFGVGDSLAFIYYAF
jgi:D-alanyl-lipoteichoic acid acyltransferase DltB (MBOAT superfamily)